MNNNKKKDYLKQKSQSIEIVAWMIMMNIHVWENATRRTEVQNIQLMGQLT